MGLYDGWCFYCQRPHASAEALRDHVRADHPESPREALYQAHEADHHG